MYVIIMPRMNDIFGLRKPSNLTRYASATQNALRSHGLHQKLRQNCTIGQSV